MNKLMTLKILASFSALSLALCLSGCGGESTNIEPEQGNITTCDSLLGVTCVTGRFIDDAVQNLDYECELTGARKVKAVTGADGSFSCPNGSEATFSLINPDEPEYRIVLGSVIVSKTAKLNGDNPVIPVYFYVTPIHLSKDTQPSSSSLSISARNITRLLQAMNRDTIDPDNLATHRPTRRVVISDDDKRKITPDNLELPLKFEQPIAADPANPGEGTFDESVKNYLTAISKDHLIDDATAKEILQKGIYSTVAGVYVVPGASLISTGQIPTGGVELDADTGAMVGYAGTDTFLGAFWNVVDRRGRMIGSGVYSYGSNSAGDEGPFSIWNDPKPFELASSGISHVPTGVPLWPNNGDLTHMVYRLLDANRSETGRTVEITQGSMRREAVAGSLNVYRNLFDEEGTTQRLGKWSLKEGLASTPMSGVYTLAHSVPVATWMNPRRWGEVSFPLAITVNLFNQDFDSITGGQKIAEVRMVILEDGNIISDLSRRCGVGLSNFDTLTYESGDQEIPLGVVANILDTLRDENNASMVTMTLLSMLPNHEALISASAIGPSFEQYLPYVQFASNLGGNSLLRVNGANPQMYGTCSQTFAAEELCTQVGGFAPGTAIWLNYNTFLKYIKEFKKSAPNPTVLEELYNNSSGRMEVTRSECDVL